MNEQDKAQNKLVAPKKQRHERKNRRLIQVVFEVFFILLIVCGVALSYGAWLIHKKPLNMGFAKPYLEEQLRNPDTGIYAKLDEVILHWPDFRGPVLVGIKGAHLLDRQNREILFIDDAALGLAHLPLLIGKVIPQALIVRNTNLHVSRSAAGRFILGFDTEGTRAAEYAGAAQTDLISHIVGYLAGTGDAAVKTDSPLVDLKRFKLENISLLIDDEILGTEWIIPRFDLDLNQLDTGLAAAYNLYLNATEEESFIQGRAVFDRQSLTTHIKTQIKNINLEHVLNKMPAVQNAQSYKGIISGEIKAQLNSQFMPSDAVLDIQVDNGALVVPSLYDTPLSFDTPALKLIYEKKDNEHITTYRMADGTLADIPLSMEGKLHYKPGSVLNAPLHIRVPHIKQKALKTLWPKGLEDEPVTAWLTQRISGGAFSDVKATLEVFGHKAEGAWDIDAKNINMDFVFADSHIQFLDNFTPAANVRGTGRMDAKSDTIRIDVDNANVQGLQVENGVVILSDVMAVGKDSAEIVMPVKARLADVFHFIAQERIGVDHGFDTAKIKGTADFTVKISMPTLTDVLIKNIDLNVEGKGVGTYLPSVISGLDLSEMTYTAKLKNDTLRIEGVGLFDDRKTDVSYIRQLDMGGVTQTGEKMRVKAKLIGDNNLLNKMGVAVDDYISGTFPVDVTYVMDRNGSAKADIYADTSLATFKIAPFGFARKGGPGSYVELSVQLKNERVQHLRNFNVAANGLRLSKGTMAFAPVTGGDMRFASLNVTAAALKETKGAFSLNQNASGALDFNFKGDVFDLRPFLKQKDKPSRAQNPPLTIDIQAQTLLTNEQDRISQGKIRAKIDGKGRFDRLNVEALAGRGLLKIDYGADQTGRRHFNLTAEDGGGALNIFGIYNKVRDGRLVINGKAATGNFEDHTINGTAFMTDFRVRKAPVLGKLLSALSLPGLLQLVDGDGVVFKKMATDFSWQYRPHGSVIRFKDGRTSGNSLGLTFDGKIDNAQHSIDADGTLIPLSGLNKTITEIPLIGDLLSGGSESLFSATYTIKGNLDDPKVSVNPLSVLTPGILRRVLFENQSDDTP
jgi:hypothetical protein